MVDHKSKISELLASALACLASAAKSRPATKALIEARQWLRQATAVKNDADYTDALDRYFACEARVLGWCGTWDIPGSPSLRLDRRPTAK